jgi:uncharacterized C2H2 Zn-finger protein
MDDIEKKNNEKKDNEKKDNEKINNEKINNEKKDNEKIKCPKCERLYNNMEDLSAHLAKGKHKYVKFNIDKKYDDYQNYDEDYQNFEEEKYEEEKYEEEKYDEEKYDEETYEKKYDKKHDEDYYRDFNIDIEKLVATKESHICHKCLDKFNTFFELSLHIEAIHAERFF